MKTPNYLVLSTAALLFVSGLCIISAQASICPAAEKIYPCTCEEGQTTLLCEGGFVNEVNIENAIRELREVNGVSGPNDWLDMYRYSMFESNVTTIDMTPFIRTRWVYWRAARNRIATSIVGPPLENNEGLIEAQTIWMQLSPLPDEGFHDFFKYFSSNLTTAYISQNWLTGTSTNLIGDGSGDIEFLPGMAALSNLDNLGLSYNYVWTVRGGKFKRNTRLTQLDLDHCDLETVGEDAFLFDDPPSDMVDKRLTINFNHDVLHQDRIHPNSGIDRIKRPVTWHLWFNQLTSLPADKFQPFLDAHPDNILQLYGNPLECDGQVKWLKDRREEYEPRVEMAVCVNDPGQTVFNSTLVDA